MAEVLNSDIPATTFADRIKVLIQRAGSATEIARRCGFSEGVVRSWRDGHTDPSRARCVTLAKTLGVSLVWLVAGEGQILADPSADVREGGSSLRDEVAGRGGRLGAAASALQVSGHAVDSERLSVAMKVLQSNLALANSSLRMVDNTDLLADLYDLLGPHGVLTDAEAMVAFNERLARRLGSAAA
ncbi:helix-turn-helix domain-containing protein [Frateuria aurantia]